MGDTIFGNTTFDDNEPGDGRTPANDTVTLSKDQFDALQAQISELTAKVNERPPPAPPQQPQPPQQPNDPTQLSPEEAIKVFADNPADFTAKVADGRISTAVQEQLAPLMQPLLQTTHENIIGQERARLDAILGAGKFDEIIMPALEDDLAALRDTNQAALASQDTIKALVQRIEGQKRSEINTAEAAYNENRDKANDELTARVIQQLPPSMRPRAHGQQQTLDDEAKTFFDEIEKATGQRPDEKSFIALQNAKPGVQGYLEAMNSINDNKEGNTNQ